MAFAVQKSTLEDLTRAVNAERAKPRSSELVLKRLEREATALLKAQDSEVRTGGLVLLGAIEALRFEVDGTRRYFEQALAASGRASIVYVNYASTLATLGLSSEAAQMIEKAIDRSPDIATLREALKLSANGVEPDRTRHYAAWLGRLDAPDDDPEVRKALESLLWQEFVLQTPGATVQALRERYECARSIAHAHRVRIRDERATLSSRGALVEWAAMCGDDAITRMNFEVAEALAALEPNPVEERVAFGYTPLAVEAAIAAA